MTGNQPLYRDRLRGAEGVKTNGLWSKRSIVTGLLFNLEFRCSRSQLGVIKGQKRCACSCLISKIKARKLTRGQAVLVRPEHGDGTTKAQNCTHRPSSFAISARMTGVDLDFRFSSTKTGKNRKRTLIQNACAQNGKHRSKSTVINQPAVQQVTKSPAF